MKICQKCNHQNDDSMSFCLQCGTPLSAPTANLNDPRTQAYQGGPTANVGANRETETVVSNQNQFGNNPNQFGANFQQPQPPPRKRSYGKIFLVLGGLLAIFLLFAAAGVAIVAYNIFSKKPTPYPTPYPTATRTTSPTPAFSPTYAPSVNPPTPNPNSKAVAKFDKMSVDYNINDGGRFGMRIHTTFSTSGMKGVDSYLAIYFQRKDGSMLTTTNDTYKSKTGQLSLFKALKPTYDEAVFKDIQLFMPYDELNLPQGKYDLQLVAYVIYQSGDPVTKLNTYDFQYEALPKK